MRKGLFYGDVSNGTLRISRTWSATISTAKDLESAPIGILDSGLGGLTVLSSLIKCFPNERFIYVGDSARIPYGNKSSSTIAKYLNEIVQYLAQEKVKAIVVACNSASTVVDQIQSETPIYNVITPGAKAAANWTESGRIGVIATRATIRKNSYVTSIQAIKSDLKIYQQACPLFVPLVEEGWVEDPVTNLIVYRYLSPLLAANIDTLVLGCTHYPILKPIIQKVMGSGVELIESGETLAAQLKTDFQTNKILPNHAEATSSDKKRVSIRMTDLSDSHQTLAVQILQPFTDFEMSLINLN